MTKVNILRNWKFNFYIAEKRKITIFAFPLGILIFKKKTNGKS